VPVRIASWSQLVADSKAKEFRLQPRRPQARKSCLPGGYCSAYLLILRYAQEMRAHGRYIARETASQGRTAEAGFNATERGIDVAHRLGEWQSAGDERMWSSARCA
jgi:hypothetical protein